MSEEEMLQDDLQISWTANDSGFWFFVPRRFAWMMLKEQFSDPLAPVNYVPPDEWKLKKGV